MVQILVLLFCLFVFPLKSVRETGPQPEEGTRLNGDFFSFYEGREIAC